MAWGWRNATTSVAGVTDSITVTSTVSEPSRLDFLRVTEIMYNPPDPTAAELAVSDGFDNDDFEFLELTNVSSLHTLDLTGVRITEGPSRPFELATPEVSSLAPGQRVLVVGDLLAGLPNFPKTRKS